MKAASTAPRWLTYMSDLIVSSFRPNSIFRAVLSTALLNRSRRPRIDEIDEYPESNMVNTSAETKIISPRAPIVEFEFICFAPLNLNRNRCESAQPLRFGSGPEVLIGSQNDSSVELLQLSFFG